MVSLTDKEAGLFAAVIQHCADLKTDWDAVATQTGYKDAKNAKIMFSRFRDKLVKAGSGAVAGTGAPAGGVDKTSPNKKARPGPKKDGGKKGMGKGKVVKVEDGDEEDEEEGVVKKEEGDE